MTTNMAVVPVPRELLAEVEGLLWLEGYEGPAQLLNELASAAPLEGQGAVASLLPTEGQDAAVVALMEALETVIDLTDKPDDRWTEADLGKRRDARNVLRKARAAHQAPVSPAEQVGWRPIETAPDLERVMVCGWQPPHGRTAGYWWWYEDAVSEGRAIERPTALYWSPIVLPVFPTPPADRGIG